MKKSWADQLADLEDPTPRDADPEEDPPLDDNSDDGHESDQNDTREHYEVVEHSRLRRSGNVDLPPQYHGRNVSRDKIELDDDEALDNDLASENHSNAGSGSDSHSSRHVFNDRRSASDSSGDRSLDDSDSDLDMEKDHASDGESSATDDTLHSDTDDQREELQRILAQDRQALSTTISAAKESDTSKGQALRKQRHAFDALLNGRIKLQKGLIAANTSSLSVTEESGAEEPKELVARTEEAVMHLWDELNNLRRALNKQNVKTERSKQAAASSTPGELWASLQTQEHDSRRSRRAILQKWSDRTNPIASAPQKSRFSQTPSRLPLTSVLDQYLAEPNLSRIVTRSRTPRSCAPSHQAQGKSFEAQIYDDADLYTLLLRELVDSRMASNEVQNQVKVATFSLPAPRELKVKKVVDTKASKGRKLRYTVHEKLQNFTVAEDRGNWGDRQRDELFSSLFGRTMDMQEMGGPNDEVDIPTRGDETTAAGLRLFG